MIWIFDRNGDAKAILSNDSPEACPFFGDEYTENISDDMGLFVFNIPEDHETASLLTTKDIVSLRDLDGDRVGFYVRKIDDNYAADGTKIKEVTAEGIYSDLLGHTVREASLTAASTETALSEILTGSGWIAGRVDWVGNHDFVLDQPVNAVKALKQLKEIYDIELKFTVQFDGGRIARKEVNIYRQRGIDTGKRFEYRKDIKGLRRTEDTTDMATALVGVGARQEDDSYLDFKDVEWTVAGGDPADKPLGQDWVGDNGARLEWGVAGRHVTKVFLDTDIEDGTELLNKTWKVLQDAKLPRYTYEVDVLLLGRLAGYEHEAVRCGDRVLIKNIDMTPEVMVTARIIQLSRSMSDPTRDSAVLGDFRPALTRDLSEFREIQVRLSEETGLGKLAYNGTIKYRSPGAPTNNPTPTGKTAFMNTDGSLDITINWSQYTQGAVPADNIILFWKKGNSVGVGAPGINDSSVAFAPNTTGAASHTLEGLASDKYYSFGLAAARKTETGVVVGAIQSIGAIQDVTDGTPIYGGHIIGSDIYVPSFENPKFYVDSAGNMTATGANVSGHIEAESGFFNGELGIRARGGIETALKFNGESTWIDVPADDKFKFGAGEKITIEADFYFKGHGTENTRYIFANRPSFQEGGNYAVNLTTNKPQFHFTPGQNWTADNAVSEDMWHSIEINFVYGDGASIEVKLNGEVISGSWTSGNGNETPDQLNNPQIGAQYGGDVNRPWNGNIRNVKLYKNDILVDSWALDEGTGSVAASSSGTSDGAIYNGLWERGTLTNLPLTITLNEDGIKAVKGGSTKFHLKADGDADFAGTLTAPSGSIGGWDIQTNLLRSAVSGSRIELNQNKNRVSIFDAFSEKAVMGYLDGLEKNDGSGTWDSNDYGFWAKAGDYLQIDGDIEYDSGDWIVHNDASLKIFDGSDNEIIRLGTVTGEKGLFLWNPLSTLLAKFTSSGLFMGDLANYMTYDSVDGLKVAGEITVLGGNAETLAGSQTKADSAESAAISTANTYTNGQISSLGDMAHENAVEKAKLGTTVIDGGYLVTGMVNADRIDTGTLNAARVSVGSTSGFQAGYDPSTKETPAGAQSKADAAESAAISAASVYTDSQMGSLGDMAYEDAVEAAKLGSTIIEGGYLKTGFVDASRIDTGTLNAARVSIGPTSAFGSDYDPSTKETPDGASLKAWQAQMESSPRPYFNGTNAWVDIPADDKFKFAGGEKITIKADFYFKGHGTENTRYIFANRPSFQEGGNYAVNLTTNRPQFHFTPDQSWTADNVVSEDMWHSIEINFVYGDGASIEVKLNGEVISGSWTSGNGNETPDQPNNPQIGAQYGSDFNRPWNGNIRNVKLYKDDALVDSWLLNEGSGNIAESSTGTSDGEIINCDWINGGLQKLPLNISLGQHGIKAIKGGDTKFWLKDDGDAIFAGELSAAIGTFAGELSAASGSFSTLTAGSSTHYVELTSLGLNGYIAGNNRLSLFRDRFLLRNTNEDVIGSIGNFSGDTFFINAGSECDRISIGDGTRWIYINDGANGIQYRAPTTGKHDFRGADVLMEYDLEVLGTITEISSKEVKEDIKESESVLDKVIATKVYDYKKIGAQKQLKGFIAEEVPENMRNTIVQKNEEKETIEGVILSSAIGYLWKGLQELNEKIERLEKSVK